MDKKQPILLNDEQMRQFITNGFLILNTDFSAEFHESLMAQLNKVYQEEGNPGNNLLPRIREIQKVFDHPVITGALSSVLGPDYMLHAHRHGHFNANPVAGGWHKDSYWGYSRMRNHHPWWAMIMYFPQDTPPELGPTGIMPGTQNYETRIFDKDEAEGEALASGQAGTFALIHYDIWHRSTPNVLGNPRYMLKFEFMRTQAPVRPTWDTQGGPWSAPAGIAPGITAHDRLWEETWNWLSGELGSLADTQPGDDTVVRELALQLEDDYEPNALNAAYELASRGEVGVRALLEALRHEKTAVSRLAAYGLSASGESAVPGLIAELDTAREITVVHAAFALGELRQLAVAAVPRLNGLMEHASVEVRRTAVEALGMIGRAAPDTVQGLIRGLQDEDTQIRFMTGLALTRLGRAGEAAIPELERALDDDNRYVRAHAAEALRYIGTPEAHEVLIRELFQSRWCATTTKASTFYP
ncbi:Phytanoyl-CoA dioxygenase (PhyH) [Paenibacillus sp. UNCCL117]|uniref:HEAT repeat domain-containing protein n=1 Tax=unclassified Paenibacillus TaxID=185978 RepID=UPI00088CD6F3|nr:MULTISPECIES: HEAT repeat domain-containing protein [unclassified Paenibacillus]SDD12705.1 Phytanoyl-CoA dioxygenase (PhyH) [Paenibacillus sp. cl123]SFW33841.1 Phytanoyl-CoA dioxygenase (PhyH) [Paenibacillus sp. UNCCL117]